jgi:uncharacterized protein YndB with AHSA1/START domain
MTEDRRSIDLSVEVTGTPEEVWRAIATGPGISSWYVPHVVDEREGGAATASFGAAPELQVPGRVAAWEPPRRIVFDGGEGVGGLAFEWLVEARDGGTCVVRLVNTGFGDGRPWDDQYDAMTEGWKLFLRNLQLHMEHFRGDSATSMLPMAMWSGTRADVWHRLTAALGLPATPALGDRVAAQADDAPPLGGTVVDTTPGWIALVLDEPTRGTAIVAAEGMGDAVGVSVWSYLYGPDAPAVVARDKPRWETWLAAHAVG